LADACARRDGCAVADGSAALALTLPWALAPELVVLGATVAAAAWATGAATAAAVRPPPPASDSPPRPTMGACGDMLESPKHGCAGVADIGGVCADAEAASPFACDAKPSVADCGRDADENENRACGDAAAAAAGGRRRLLFSISETMIEWRGVGDLRPGVRTGVTEAAVDANG
jgi:hypothetical protein